MEEDIAAVAVSTEADLGIAELGAVATHLELEVVDGNQICCGYHCRYCRLYRSGWFILVCVVRTVFIFKIFIIRLFSTLFIFRIITS